MKIEMWALDRIIPYADNPRRGLRAVTAVAKSLATYGWRQPLVVDAAGVLIAGHVRLAAARQLGWATAPVHVAADLTPEQARAYRLADNKTAELAEWDPEMLAAELRAMAETAEPLEVPGFSEEELSGLLRQVAPPLDPEDAAPSAGPVVTCPRCGHEFKA